MTAHKRNDSYFHELDGELQRLADEWLVEYVRLILRLVRNRRGHHRAESYPQSALDDDAGTGKVRTPRTADPPPNLPT
jgi:hypothetical protein